MAYPVYDNYAATNSVAFPMSRRQSMYGQHPTDMIFDAPVTGGAFDVSVHSSSLRDAGTDANCLDLFSACIPCLCPVPSSQSV